MKFKKTIYISFDFGMKGDYEGLYLWLDENNAEERGYGLAIIKHYEYIPKTNDKSKIDLEFFEYLKNEIGEYVDLGKSDRIYAMWKSFHKNGIRGAFLFGNKKQAPWVGYSQEEDNFFDFE